MTRILAGIVSLCVLTFGSGGVLGQEYPNKPIRILAGGAGGGSDFDARQVAQGISGPLGQSVIVDNRASALITAETLAKSAPDGYTLMVNGSSSWINPLLQKTPYDTLRDFAPITHIARSVQVVAVHPSVPAKTIKDLIALAKAKPGELNYGAVTVGGPAHLAGELFKSLAQVQIVSVHFKAQAASVTALISGEVQLMFSDSNAVLPHAKAGKLRALAITSAEPSAVVPGLPTVAASGLPGYELVGAGGMWAPVKTPVAIINRLNQEAVRTLNRADVKERYFNAGLEILTNSPEAFDALIRADIARMGKVIKDAGIKVD